MKGCTCDVVQPQPRLPAEKMVFNLISGWCHSQSTLNVLLLILNPSHNHINKEGLLALAVLSIKHWQPVHSSNEKSYVVLLLVSDLSMPVTYTGTQASV